MLAWIAATRSGSSGVFICKARIPKAARPTIAAIVRVKS